MEETLNILAHILKQANQIKCFKIERYGRDPVNLIELLKCFVRNHKPAQNPLEKLIIKTDGLTPEIFEEIILRDVTLFFKQVKIVDYGY